MAHLGLGLIGFSEPSAKVVPTGPPIELLVRDLSGETTRFSMRADDTLVALRAKVSVQFEVPLVDITLFRDGVPLPASGTIAEQTLPPETLLVLGAGQSSLPSATGVADQDAGSVGHTPAPSGSAVPAGCSDAASPYPRLPDANFSANSADETARAARLHGRAAGWTGHRGTELCIDLDERRLVRAVQTQGSRTSPAYVTRYELHASLDRVAWTRVMHDPRAPRAARFAFQGNHDVLNGCCCCCGDLADVSTRALPFPVPARYVKFVPLGFDGYGGDWCCGRPALRVELLVDPPEAGGAPAAPEPIER